MPFERITSAPRAGRGLTSDPDSVSIGLYFNNKSEKHSGGTVLSFFIGVNILAKMGLSPGERVEVLEGSGADFGVFKLEPAAKDARSGYTLSAKGDRNPRMVSVSVNAKHLKTLPDNAPGRPAEPAMFQRFGSSLTVLVPWCADYADKAKES